MVRGLLIPAGFSSSMGVGVGVGALGCCASHSVWVLIVHFPAV